MRVEFYEAQAGKRRVMGLARNAIATRVAARPELIWDVPDQWSLQDAVTVPLAYATAFYALLVRGRLQAGQRVLIHSGCGAVGLAAISICLNRSCEVRLPCACPLRREQSSCGCPGAM